MSKITELEQLLLQEQQRVRNSFLFLLVFNNKTNLKIIILEN